MQALAINGTKIAMCADDIFNLDTIMQISTQLSAAQHDLIINVSGDFVSTLQEKFKQAYENDATPSNRYIVDMQHVNYLDQSALNMLLELKEYAKIKQCEVGIINMQDSVLNIFHVLHFHKVFKPYYEPNLRKIIWLSTC